MNTAVKNIIFWVVMAVTALLIWAVVKSSTGDHRRDISFSEFVGQVNRDNVQEVTIIGTDLNGSLKKGTPNNKFKTTIPANFPELYKTLLEKNISVTMKDNSGTSWVTWLANGLPMILLLGLWIFFMWKMKNRVPWEELLTKQTELLERQLETLRQTNELLKRLAEAR